MSTLSISRLRTWTVELDWLTERWRRKRGQDWSRYRRGQKWRGQPKSITCWDILEEAWDTWKCREILRRVPLEAVSLLSFSFLLLSTLSFSLILIPFSFFSCVSFSLFSRLSVFSRMNMKKKKKKFFRTRLNLIGISISYHARDRLVSKVAQYILKDLLNRYFSFIKRK